MRSLLNGGAADRHVDEELQHFIDEAAAAYEADGMPAADAQRAARRRVGNTLAVREEVRASGWEHVGRNRRGRPALRHAPARRPSRLHVGHHCDAWSRHRFRDGDAQRGGSGAGPDAAVSAQRSHSRRLGPIRRPAPASRWRSDLFVEVQERSRSLESMAVSRVWQPALERPGPARARSKVAASASITSACSAWPRGSAGTSRADDAAATRRRW